MKRAVIKLFILFNFSLGIGQISAQTAVAPLMADGSREFAVALFGGVTQFAETQDTTRPMSDS